MSIRDFLRKSEAIRAIYERHGTLPVIYHGSRRIMLRIKSWIRNDRRLIKQYIKSNRPTKLQIGAGPSSIPGWLATDILPESKNILYLDATKSFPIQDNTFDYVYSEHMIEHVTWTNGNFMLQECSRILKPGGVIRIATPDLAVILGLYKDEFGELGDKYIHQATDYFLSEVGQYKAIFVINNMFRNWGHKFLYDGELLKMAFRDAGFVKIVRCLPGKSPDANLVGIETHGQNIEAEQMTAFETMVYQAMKPLSVDN